MSICVFAGLHRSVTMDDAGIYDDPWDMKMAHIETLMAQGHAQDHIARLQTKRT